MHYKWDAFSKNRKATITRKDGGNDLELGNNSGLSTEDARQMNSLYKEQCGKCNFFNPFQVNVLFQYPLKTSETFASLTFSGGIEMDIGLKWVMNSLTVLFNDMIFAHN